MKPGMAEGFGPPHIAGPSVRFIISKQAREHAAALRREAAASTSHQPDHSAELSARAAALDLRAHRWSPAWMQ